MKPSDDEPANFSIEDVNAVFQDGSDLFVIIKGEQVPINKEHIHVDSEIQGHGDFGTLIVDYSYAKEIGLDTF